MPPVLDRPARCYTEPMNDLPTDLLNRLFAPSTVYVDLATRLHGQDVSDQDFEKMGEEALDLLAFDVEIHAHSFDVGDSTTTVSVDGKSRKMMVEAFKELGSNLLENQTDIRATAITALMSDLNEKLAILDDPSRVALRDQLDVQPEWMEAVASLHAFDALLNYACNSRTPDWWSWFLKGAGAPSLIGPEGSVATMALLSRRYRDPQASVLPDAHVQPWADWALQGKKWQSLGVMHSLWLASTLADPHARLARLFDDRGLKFDIQKVDWRTVVIHANNLSENEDLKSTQVERFLEKHLEALVRIAPSFARIPHATDMEKDAWSNQKAKNMTGAKGLSGLLENVIKRDRRQKMAVELEALLLAVDTPSAPSASRSGPRL